MPFKPLVLDQSSEFLMSSSTVEEFSATLTEEEKSRHREQQAATGRKSWKTLKDKGEAVWSPIVEAALLEGLQKYKKPPESASRRDSNKKPSNRFPYRNRFISDYIEKQTGKHRTPKQVGSRLQQLRDTCRRTDIRALIVHPSDTEDSCDDDCYRSSSPSLDRSSIHRDSEARVVTLRQDLVHPSSRPQSPASIDIAVTLCLDTEASGSVHSYIPLVGYRDEKCLSTTVFLAPCTSASDPTWFSVESAVTFWSPTFPVATETSFTVYNQSLSQPIGSEYSFMYNIPSPTGRDGWTYRTNLCPKYWKLLSSDPNVTQYFIVQTIIPQIIGHGASIKVCYRFVDSPSSSASSPSSSKTPSPAQAPTTNEIYHLEQQWQPPLAFTNPPPISNISYTLAAALGQPGCDGHAYRKLASSQHAASGYRRLSVPATLGPTAFMQLPDSGYGNPQPPYNVTYNADINPLVNPSTHYAYV